MKHFNNVFILTVLIVRFARKVLDAHTYYTHVIKTCSIFNINSLLLLNIIYYLI